MAQHRQTGSERFGLRSHLDQTGPADPRIPYKPSRIRRSAAKLHHHHHRHRLLPSSSASAAALAVTLALALFVVFLALRHLSGDKGDESSGSFEFKFRSNRSKELKFGHGVGGRIGRDSRYWDGDDRRRDQDYSEDEAPKKDPILDSGESGAGTVTVEGDKKGEGRGGNKGVLYNEGGRKELDSYKEEYETSLKNGVKLDKDDGVKEVVDPDDEYDDGIDVQDDHDDDSGGGGGDAIHGDLRGSEKDVFLDNTNEKASSKISGGGSVRKKGGHMGGDSVKVSGSEKKSSSKRKPKHHKISGSTCEMKFLNSTAQIVEPVVNKKFARFSLQYTQFEDKPSGSEDWEPRFAGHQTLQEWKESYHAKDQTINCGFIKGPDGSSSIGFDISEDDRKYMSSCHIVVSSCIFGNSDRLRTPFGKTITHLSRKNVCFVMFLDENTLQTLATEGQKMDNMGFIGLWKIIMVKNLPYDDMRRVGKIPKFLAHRLFPSARYSIWLDSKLRLQRDPILILEYFLWRHGHEYAISNHYDRHCVWEEVLQNKKLNKFNHTIIDQQFEFYQSDGLKRFDPSDPNKLLPSYVPEGSFIVREHTPMSNLFSCLWFNEVDRFTPRDQLSFAYTYLKLRRMNPEKHFYLNMFKDCERRSIAKLFHHRAEEKRSSSTQQAR
ncbi:uncharacterized protein LOC109723259 isoform X2 [Ananas comosus]|uniref:Uncharacterized protein LOC109723259 isoform X2 n=1 Tax=Ananas comosus TaxID=4615 RepID=A0A6P5GH58_ANACO|nr:uncharacterized protein LOC109723259 isoform X2 [Ananas comosus]